MKRLLMAAALLFGGAAPVLAQFGSPTVVTLPGSVTQDQATESLLGDIDTTQLPAINDHITWIANSVTASGGGGWYVPMAQFIQGMDNTRDGLWSGVDFGHFHLIFPGFKPYGANSTNTMADITAIAMNTYAGALASAQAQTDEVGREDFSSLATASDNSTGVLPELRLIHAALLQIVTQLQLQRQLTASDVTVRATEAAETLNEKAQETASTQHKLLGY